MRKIIGVLQPFTMQQTFYVYEDGNKLEVVTIEDVNQIETTIFNLADKYDITQIDLSGAKFFTQRIKQNLILEEITRYAEHKLNIKCI